MNKKLKYILGSGFGLVGIIGILELIIFLSCKNDLGCFGFLLFLIVPGALIEGIFGTNHPVTLVLFNIIFYFIFGSFIGWIVWKIGETFK